MKCQILDLHLNATSIYVPYHQYYDHGTREKDFSFYNWTYTVTENLLYISSYTFYNYNRCAHAVYKNRVMYDLGYIDYSVFG